MGAENSKEEKQSEPFFVHEGPIHRSTLFPNILVRTPYRNVTTVWEGWTQGFKHHRDHPALGRRKLNPDGSAGEFVFLTYGEVSERVINVASGIKKLGLERGDRVGIYAINSMEWVITDLACQMLGMVSVPLYDSLGVDAIRFVINHARLPVIFCSKENTTKVLSTVGVNREDCESLKILVEISESNEVSGSTLEYAERVGMEVFSYVEVESEGAAAKIHAEPPKPDDIFTIMYTSGTTGVPKGVVHTHATFVATLSGILRQGVISPNKDDVVLSYLPLAHIFERGMTHLLLLQGSQIGFYGGNMARLPDDILTLRPTIFIGVPRVFSRLFQQIQRGVTEESWLGKTLFSLGYDSKRSTVKSGGHAPVWDALVFSKTAEKMGGRVKLIVSGGAPLAAEVQEFLRVCFCCPVLQVYGLTEVGAMTFATLGDTDYGHVGPPVPSCEVKLVDCEEMGYTANDKPLPRGEICCRGPSVFAGYFEDEELTKGVIDDDKWFHSGDIGQWNDNGTLTVIDRAKAMFKLSQGEYVAPEHVESVLGTNQFVSQIFVHGDSQRDAVIAIVVPDPAAIITYAQQHQMVDPENVPALLRNETIVTLLEDELLTLGKDQGLKGFEIPKGVHLESKPWVVGADLTPTMKLRRSALAAKYKPEIASLYAKVAYKAKMAAMYSDLTS